MKRKHFCPEELTVSYVLAHIAQFDSRSYRLAFTTDTATTQKMLQAVNIFSNMKRKYERDYNQQPYTKRFNSTFMELIK